MRTFVLFAMAVMLAEVYATHYRGGTFYWERLGKTKIRVYWRLAFQLTDNYKEYKCEYIGQHLEAETFLDLICLDCASNTTILTPLTLECTSISQEMGWSLLDGYVDYQADRKAFTMGYMTRPGKCKDSSWVPLENYGIGQCWSLLTTVDTSKPNDSPVVTALPVYRVRLGCKRLIDLNPIDPNQDPIKCRWTNEDECPEERDNGKHGPPVCGRATKLTKLDEKKCTIEFITGNDALVGWYGASVMIEDFPDTKFRKAKSTVPFQFLLDVTLPGSCVGPDIEVEECSIVKPGETWTSFVTASIPEGSDASSISEIQGNYPKGMRMLPYEPNKKNVRAELTFTSEHESTYIFTATATDNNGVQSKQTSGRLIVSSKYFDLQQNTPPQVLPDRSIPSINSLYERTDTLWTIKFDSPVNRPVKKAFITIKEIDTMEIVAKFNVLDSEEVTFSESDPTIVQYPAPTGLKGGKGYYITIDQGVGVKDYTTPCDRGAVTDSEVVGYNFMIPKPPEPEVKCGQSEITAYIPKSYVNNMSVNDLHLLDPRCKGNDNGTHLIVQFPYDACGTYIKKKSSDLTRFINILRDDPEPYKTSSLITRAQRQVNIRIICEVKGAGIANVFIDPNTSVASSTFKATTTLEANLELYEDNSYSTLVPYGTAKGFKFSERLFFSARARDSDKEVAIESCRATAKYKTCSKFDKKYEFISNGCPVDDTVRLTPNSLGSLDQKRFSIKTFAMINYGVDDTVWVMCSFLTCDQSNTQSACKDMNSQDCGSPTVGKRRKRSATDVVTQAFMEVQL